MKFANQGKQPWKCDFCRGIPIAVASLRCTLALLASYTVIVAWVDVVAVLEREAQQQLHVQLPGRNMAL